jgi:hypothetical protein
VSKTNSAGDRRERIDRAAIVGDIDPTEPDRFLCDVIIPDEEFVFVASLTSDGAVQFSPQAPEWLTGPLAQRLADHVRAKAKEADDDRERVSTISARRSLVLAGLLADSGRRRAAPTLRR